MGKSSCVNPMEFYGTLGFVLHRLAPFLIPIFYLAVGAECLFVYRRRHWRVGSATFGGLVAIQVLSPGIYFLFYPFFPGSEVPEGTFFIESQRDLHAAAITGILCMVVYVGSIVILCRREQTRR